MSGLGGGYMVGGWQPTLTPSCRQLIFPILGVTIHIFGLVGDKLRHF